MKPKILTTMQTYDRSQFASDLIAGVTVAMVALPLSLAIAIASGAAPEKGIVTAIVAGFLISLFGGSRVQIGGRRAPSSWLCSASSQTTDMTALFLRHSWPGSSC